MVAFHRGDEIPRARHPFLFGVVSREAYEV